MRNILGSVKFKFFLLLLSNKYLTFFQEFKEVKVQPAKNISSNYNISTWTVSHPCTVEGSFTQIIEAVVEAQDPFSWGVGKRSDISETRCSRECSTNTFVIKSLILFVQISSKHLHSQTVPARNSTSLHVSHVRWRVSHVVFHMSHINFFLSPFWDKLVKLFGGGSVFNGAHPDQLLGDQI